MNLEFEIQVVLGAGQKLFGGFFPLKGQIEIAYENILGELLADFGVTLPPPFLERIRQTVFDCLP